MISTKLAARNPKSPPITAEDTPPRAAPAMLAEVSVVREAAPLIPPTVAPMVADTGTSRPRLCRRSSRVGFGRGTAAGTAVR